MQLLTLLSKKAVGSALCGNVPVAYAAGNDMKRDSTETPSFIFVSSKRRSAILDTLEVPFSTCVADAVLTCWEENLKSVCVWWGNHHS